jgi:hypothetical protein
MSLYIPNRLRVLSSAQHPSTAVAVVPATLCVEMPGAASQDPGARKQSAQQYFGLVHAKLHQLENFKDFRQYRPDVFSNVESFPAIT